MSLVLIADDNPHAHRMGRQILSQEGHDVVTVSNGDEALQYLGENHPDLIMADTRMPGPNGYEVCRQVKKGGRFPDARVVLLAGPLEPFDPELAAEVGSDAVLHKPLDAYSLIETINRLLGEPTADPVQQPPEPELEDDGETVTDSAPAVATLEALIGGEGDPFEELVEQALGKADAQRERESQVRGAVTEVLQASLPTLVETLTQRVLERLNGNH
ncbi:MAG: response regulator [Bryobacterales bacterium]